MNAVALSSADLPAMQSAAMTGLNAFGGTVSSNAQWFLLIAMIGALCGVIFLIMRSVANIGGVHVNISHDYAHERQLQDKIFSLQAANQGLQIEARAKAHRREIDRRYKKLAADRRRWNKALS